MTLLYHGTSTNMAIEIARAGTILSPWLKEINYFRRLYTGQENLFKKRYPDKTMEQVGLEVASGLYARHELEDRVKSVSFTLPFSLARGYAMQNERYNGGGVVLGIEITPEIKTNLPENWEQLNCIFVRKQLSIKSLREVHLSPRCKADAERIVRKEFERYNPKYIVIE